MRKALKRVLSTALAGLMLASSATVANIAVSANSGQKVLSTFQDACDIWWYDYLGQGDVEAGKAALETVEYLFYMPEDMKNEYNDYYDGSDPTTYCAGIYWWNGTATPGNFPYNTKDWPGYAVTKTDPDCPNVYIAEVPSDVPTVVWNNGVDGGTDNTQPFYTAAMQGDDAGVTGYDKNMDAYGFYPDGLESMAGMIYVCNPADTVINPASQKVAFKGEWFYYYGNGEYGFAPTREEAGSNVYSNGEFPPTGLVMSAAEVKAGVGGVSTIKANKAGTTATSENEAIATVTANEEGTSFTIKGVSAGTTNIVFEWFNEGTQETNKVTVPVTVTAPYFDYSSLTMNVGDTEYNIGYGFGEDVQITYSKSGIVTYDGLEVVAKKAGTVTVNCTQGGATFSFKVTVNAPKPSISAAKSSIKAGTTTTIKVKNGKATKFASSNPKVAKVDSKGKVTALTKGTVTITATISGKKYNCKVKVTSNPTVAKKSVSVKVKKSVTVKVTGAASTPSVSKCKYATVKATKTSIKITGKKKGTQTLTVKVNGKSFKLKVTVKK